MSPVQSDDVANNGAAKTNGRSAVVWLANSFPFIVWGDQDGRLPVPAER